MAQLARSFDHIESRSVELPGRPAAIERLAGTGEWAQSPARLLHERLVATYAPRPVVQDEHRFSLRVRLFVALAASAAGWAVIGAIAMAILD